MLNFVEDVLDFLDGKKPVHEQLELGMQQLGKQELRVVCIKLAGWWRRDVSNENRLPTLPLNDHFSWCDNLRRLHETAKPMVKLFAIANVACSYSSDLPSRDIVRINQLAIERYKPSLSVTLRRDNDEG